MLGLRHSTNIHYGVWYRLAEKVGADWPADQAVVDGNFRTEVKE
jgi:hypothetical protein